LKQSELAELVGCSTVTIQSVEVNRLKLSKSLAARISLQTGADMDWLLANDVNIPMPPRPFFMDGVTAPLQNYVSTICLLMDVFSRLFAAARRLRSGGARAALELHIAAELDKLKDTVYDPKAEPTDQTSREVFQYFNEHLNLDPKLADMLDLDYLIRTAKPQAKLGSERTNPMPVNAQPARREEMPSRRQERESPRPGEHGTEPGRQLDGAIGVGFARCPNIGMPERRRRNMNPVQVGHHAAVKLPHLMDWLVALNTFYQCRRTRLTISDRHKSDRRCHRSRLRGALEAVYPGFVQTPPNRRLYDLGS
jgi:hypothetical protein